MALGLEEITDTRTTGRNSSSLDRIRARFEQAKAGQHLDLQFPNNPDLGVRYKAIDDDEMDRLATGEETHGIDYLIAACECILVREQHGWEPLLTGNDEPVRFDHELSEILDLNVPPAGQGGTARDVVMAVFSTAPSPKLAAGKHVARVTAWLSGGSVDSEEMLGES